MAAERDKVTREKIIEIATESIDDCGYHGMTLKDVAKRLNVTRPALYYYYSRKNELLLDMHNRAQVRLLDSAQTIFELEVAPLEHLYLLLHNHALIATKHAGVVAVMFQEEHNLTTLDRKKIRATRIAYTQRFVDTYQEAKDQGCLSADSDPRLTAFLMLGACNWITQWYALGEWSPKYIAETAAQNLLRGVLTEKGREAAVGTSLLGS